MYKMEPYTRKLAVTARVPPTTRCSALKQLFQGTEQEDLKDEDSYVSVGIEAKLGFYDSYRGLNKVRERNRFEQVQDSPALAYLNEVKKQKISPRPFGIVKRRGKNSSIDLSMQGMGDRYARALSRGLVNFRPVSRLILRSNRLSDRGSISILNRVNARKLKEIDLSNNTIGELSSERIFEIIRKKESALTILALENVGLEGVCLQLLAAALTENHGLLQLNLAKNRLDSRAGAHLKDLVLRTHSLQRLDLH